MKRAAIGAMLALLAGCQEPAEEDVEIAPAAGDPVAVVGAPQVALPSPTRGGTVLMAGPRPFEVVADRSGQIHAYYVAQPPSAPQDARVTVRVPDAQGQVRPVLLTWDPTEVRYSGRLRGAQPAPGPIELVFVLGGETLRAAAQTFLVIDGLPTEVAIPVRTPRQPPPQPQAPPPPQPHVIVQPPPPPHVVVQPPPPPRPHVIVQPPPPPRPHVIVQPPPPPRPHVVVQPPPPPRPHVVVQPPQPPRPHVVVQPPRPEPRVVVRPAERPEPRVVVQPPQPRVVVQPPRSEPRVVVRPAERPEPRVVVRPAEQERPRVIVRPPGDRNRGHGNDRDGHDEDNPGRGRRR